MIRLKIVFLCLSFILLCAGGNAQSSRIDSLPPATGSSHGYNLLPFGSNLLPLHQLHVGVQVGTQFTTTSGYGSGFSTFLSPTLSYRVSNRFSLSGGISVVNTTLYGVKPFYSFAEEKPMPGFSGNITQTTLWVSGQYLLSDRVTLTGTIFKTVDILGQKPGNYPFYNNNPQGGYLNVGYKVSDHMQIQAGFGYTKGSYGSPYNPYNPVFGSSNVNPFFNR
jgi:hypothetical protein